MRRVARFLRDALANLLTAAMLVAAILVWRVGERPIAADALTPRLEAALSGGSVDIDIGSTSLDWYGPDLPVGVTLGSVAVRGADGEQIAHVPEMWVGLSVAHLLRGEIVAREVVLVRPHLQVVRDEQHGYRIAVLDATHAGSAPGREIGLEESLDAVARPPEDGGDFVAGLRRLRILQGEIEIDDRVLDMSTHAFDATVRVERTGGALLIGGNVSLLLDDRVSRYALEASYPYGGDAMDVRLEFDDLVPARLARRDALLAPLEAAGLPVDGWAEGRLDTGLNPLSLRFHAEGRSGRLDVPSLFAAPVGIAGLAADGMADFERGVLTLESLRLDLGGPAIEATAQGTIRDGTVVLEGRGSLHDMPVDLLDSFWPPPLGANVRAWITENLSRGVIRLATAEFRMSAPADDWSAAEMVALSGDMALEDMTVRYIEGMPAITGLDGDVEYDLDQFRILTRGGDLSGLLVTQGDLLIHGFDRPDALMDIDVVLQGGVSPLLTVLDSPVLGYATAIGLQPTSSTGVMSGRLRLSFPLIDELPLERVALAASANLRGTRFGEMLDGIVIDGVDGALRLDGQRMGIRGTGRANGVPLSFDWSEPFTPTAADRRRLTVSGTLDDSARAALGLDLGERVQGAIRVDAAYSEGGAGAEVEATVDFADAALALPMLDWSKRPGEAASLAVEIALVDGLAPRVPRFTFQGGDLWASGSLQFTADGEVALADLNEVGLRGNRLAARVSRRDDGGLAIEARGERLDLTPYVDALTEADAAAQEGGGTDSLPLGITLAFDRIDLGEQRTLFAVNGYVSTAGEGLQQADLAARTSGGGEVRATYQPTGAGAYFTLQAEPAGTVLRDLDILETMDGGRLTLTGERATAAEAYDGSLRVASFRLRDAPALAHILSAMSFGGLADLLGSAEGLVFDGLAVDIALQDDVVQLRDGRASGGALGLTLDGRIDLNQSTIAAEGTIVPIYGVNQVIGEIPVLGFLLTGGDGEGLFAFTYRIQGPLDNPSASVNPLSVLAPGFLRRLFFETDYEEVAREPSGVPEWPTGPGR